MGQVYQVTCGKCGRLSGKYTTEVHPLEVLLRGAGWSVRQRRAAPSYLCPGCKAVGKR